MNLGSKTTTSVTEGKELPVMESFYTIQGEGFHQGKAAYFVRLGGCDVGCHWCDVKESWEADKHALVPVEKIADESSLYPGEMVVITGGEPLLYNLTVLCDEIHRKNKRTHLETSGSSPLTGLWDWICVSPKKFKFPLPDVVERANELKVIIFNKSDFDWAETWAAQANERCRLYLQPEWENASAILPLIIDYVKKNPKWRISLQIHKYLNVP